MTEYKAGDRVIVNTKKVANKKGTIGAGRNGNFYLGKLDDGRSFQATAEHLTPVSPAPKEVQACRSALYLAASNAMPETTAKLLSYIVCQGPTRTDALGAIHRRYTSRDSAASDGAGSPGFHRVHCPA